MKHGIMKHELEGILLGGSYIFFFLLSNRLLILVLKRCTDDVERS